MVRRRSYYGTVDGRVLIHVLPLAFVDNSQIAAEVLGFYDRLPQSIAQTLTDEGVFTSDERIRSAIDAYVSPEMMRAAR